MGKINRKLRPWFKCYKKSSDVEIVSQDNIVKADKISDIFKRVWFQI